MHTHSRDSARSIFDFLGHVHGAVDTLNIEPRISKRDQGIVISTRLTNDKGSRSSHLAHNAGSSHRRPASKILELARHISHRSSRSKSPERDDNDQNPDEEHDEDNTFEKRQVFGGEDVEGDGERPHGHGHQSSLPGREGTVSLTSSNRGGDVKGSKFSLFTYHTVGT